MDRSELFDAAIARDCLEALEAHGVLVFPRIGLSDEEQLALTGCLGERAKLPEKVPGSKAAAPGVYKITLDPEIKEAVLFPRRNFEQLKEAWYLPLVQFVPGIASIVNRGWRLQLIAQPDEELIPKPQDLPRCLLYGLVLWGMYSLYLLPQLLFLILDRFEWIFDLIGVVQYVVGVVLNRTPASGLGTFLSDVGMGFLLKSGFLVFYPIASWPFYRVAMLRYARDKDFTVFFDFPTNWKIVTRSYSLLMHVYLQQKLVWLLAGVVTILVSWTVVGAVLIPLAILPLRLLVSGLLYRNLATKLRAVPRFAAPEAAEEAATASIPAGRLAARRWFVAAPGVGSKEVDLHGFEDASRREHGAAGEQRPSLFWSTGMWRWSTAGDAQRFLARLASAAPPAEEPRSEDLPLAERIKKIPAEAFRQFGPARIWKDARELIVGEEGDSVRKLWRSRLTWFVCLQYVPVLASVVNRGWRIDLMRSAAAGQLPDRRDVGRHLAMGLLLWIFYLVYLIPFFALLVLTDFKWVEQVVGLVWWLFQSLVGAEPAASPAVILGSGLLRFVLETAFTLAYPVLTWPLFRGAMIRYALEDDLRVFAQLGKNRRLAKMDFDTYAGMYLAQKTLWGLHTVLSLLLLATGVGAIVIPVLLVPIRMLASALIYLRGLRTARSMAGFFPS